MDRVPRGQVEELGLIGVVRVRQIDDNTFMIPLAASVFEVLVTIKKDVPGERWRVIIGDVLNYTRSAR